ncbi:hypothetical protein Tco_0309796 [Tanacetum coccineum]
MAVSRGTSAETLPISYSGAGCSRQALFPRRASQPREHQSWERLVEWKSMWVVDDTPAPHPCGSMLSKAGLHDADSVVGRWALTVFRALRRRVWAKGILI